MGVSGCVLCGCMDVCLGIMSTCAWVCILWVCGCVYCLVVWMCVWTHSVWLFVWMHECVSWCILSVYVDVGLKQLKCVLSECVNVCVYIVYVCGCLSSHILSGSKDECPGTGCMRLWMYALAHTVWVCEDVLVFIGSVYGCGFGCVLSWCVGVFECKLARFVVCLNVHCLGLCIGILCLNE